MRVYRTDEFQSWLDNLRDKQAKARITRHLEHLVSRGLFGDIAPIGKGLSEMRFHFGPGYRVYFIQRGSALIVILGGGDKDTQQRDIAAAKNLAESLED